MSAVQFRGRRVLDPVPVQRRSLPQEARYRQSKFSDLEEAWKNVGEVKSALEAAEDRIHEVQLSANHRSSPPCEPLQEIFSERQRYGRVARYNLRPDHHTKDIPQPLSPRRPKTQQAHPPIMKQHKNTGQSYSREPCSWTSADIVPRTSSSIDFEDSLEVPVRTATQRVDARPSSAIGVKAVIDSNSDVLTRLKERIRLQKKQATKISKPPDTDKICGNGLSAKPSAANPSFLGSEDNSGVKDTNGNGVNLLPPALQLRTAEDTVLQPEVVQFTRPPLAKRKIASAPAAPVYKGFNEVDERPVRDQEHKSKITGKEAKAHQRNTYEPYTKGKSVIKDTSRPLKLSQNMVPWEVPIRGGRKVQRVTAPRQPKDIISTASWRTGQQTVKRVLGPPPKKKSPKRTQSKISTSSGSSTLSKADSLSWKEADVERENKNNDKILLNGNHLRGAEEKDSDNEANDMQDMLSEHSLSPTDSELQREFMDDAKRLKDSKVLSTEARNVLSDLDLSSEHSGNEEEEFKEVSKLQPHQNVIRGKKRKAPSKPKLEPAYPKEKLRHYDAEEVKKYMAKQVADRKKKIKEEKVMKQKAIDDRKKKLEELYSKQKKTLQANLATKEKKRMGTTFSKGRSDPKSFIFPLHHPFHEDELIEAIQDSEISESDKENLDIASYKGLPTRERYSTRNIDEIRYPLDTQSEPSESVGTEMNMKDFDEVEVNSYAPFDNVNTVDAEVKTAIASSGPLTTSEGSDDTNLPSTVQSIVSDHQRVPSPASPNREDRINAIKYTAAALKERLEAEARRLGLNLEAKALGDVAQTNLHAGRMPVDCIGSHPEFRGSLPGVVSIHEQADLNKELNALDVAATKIQAVYRGHSVRQGLNWKLPSGQTLGATLRNAPRVSRAENDSVAEAVESYYTPTDDTLSVVDTDSIADSATGFGSRSEPTATSSRDQRHRFGNILQQSGRSARDTASGVTMPQSPSKKGNICPPAARKPWPPMNGDSLSVINIFTRQHPYLKVIEDDITKDPGSETASLLETEKNQDTASLLASVDELDQGGDLEKTLTEEAREDYGDDYEDDFTEPSHEDTRGDTSRQRTPSPGRKTPHEESSYSQSFANPSPSKKTGTSPSEYSTGHNISSRTSSYLDSGELSTRDPVMTSTLRPASAQTEAPRYESPGYRDRIHPSTPYFHVGQEGNRLSPGSLDHRMMAELHRLENMEESVRQLTDVERTRAVSLAQQETVSLAQILKARQQSHAREMESLRLRAKQEALEAARQLEEARRAAAVAAAEASETVAMVRTEAANAVSHSADRLAQVQNDAAKATVEAAKQIEEARLSAAKYHLEAARQQSVDVHTVAASAASAAATAAVKSALHQYQQPRKVDSSRSYNESSSYSRSYTDSGVTPTYSRTRSTYSEAKSKSLVNSASGGGYTSEEFESYADSRLDRTLSVPTASGVTTKETVKDTTRSSDRTLSFDMKTASPSSLHSRQTSERGTDKVDSEKPQSVSEDIDHSIAESINTDVGVDSAPNEDSATEILSQGSKRDEARKARPSSQDAQRYSINFEDTMMSSHTATDDELDYRSVLPSESHRRRSLEKIKRRGSIGSETGTFSYSSDEVADLTLADTFAEREEDGVAGPFSGEDSFIQFTSDMVRNLKEEEARAKHQAALLTLREKALKEKTKAEMAWLDLQKKSLRDKGADDVMPSLRKRQRGILMKLHAEQAEIKRLKTANRAASYERRLLLLQQEEIARLRMSAKNIRHRVADEKGTERPREETKLTLKKKHEAERYTSSAQSDGIPEELSERSLENIAADRSTRNRSERSPRIDVAKSVSKSASVPEDISDAQSPIITQADSSFPTYDATNTSSHHKRSFSDGESDEGSISSEKHSATKTSPTSSGRTISKQLKKLKQLESDERFLTQREIQLKKRRKEAEKLLENRKKLVEWKKRLDEEDKQVRNLINQALNLKNATSPTQHQVRRRSASEQDLVRDKSLSASKSLNSTESTEDRAVVGLTRTADHSGSSTTIGSKPLRAGLGRRNSESSVPEEVPSGGGWESEIGTELSSKIKSRGSSMPEEIAGEYTNDTFESVESTLTPSHSTPVRQDASPVISRRSSKDEGSKSEEDLSMTETSDHSDIEVRIRTLKSQLVQRKREAERLYHERKRQRKALLRAQEDSLRKELQEVELVISRTRKELEKEPTQNRVPDIKPSLAPKEIELVKQPKLETVVLVPESPSTIDHESSTDTSINEVSELSSKVEPARERFDQIDIERASKPNSMGFSENKDLRDTSEGVVPIGDIEEQDQSRVDQVVDKSSEVKDLDISDRSRSASPAESLSANESIEIEEQLPAIGYPSSSDRSEVKTESSLSEKSARSISHSPKLSDIVSKSKSRHSALDATLSNKSLSKGEQGNKSPLSAKGYSMSFESDVRDEASTADDISERLSVEEEPSIPEEVSEEQQKLSENSEIKEDLSLEEPATRGLSPPNISMQELNICKDTLEVPSRKGLDTTSYSADFEVPSVAENVSTRSEQNIPVEENIKTASSIYTSNFEKEITVKGTLSSLYTADFEGSVSSKKGIAQDALKSDDVVSSTDTKLSQHGEQLQLKDVQPVVSKGKLSTPSDSDTIADEIPEDLPEESEADASLSVASDDDKQDIEKGKSREIYSVLVDVPSDFNNRNLDKMIDGQPMKKPDTTVPLINSTDRITEELSAMLMRDAVDHIAGVYRSRQAATERPDFSRVGNQQNEQNEDFPTKLVSAPLRVDIPSKPDKINIEELTDAKSLETPTYLKGDISEEEDLPDLSFDKDDSVSGLDFRTERINGDKPIDRIPRDHSLPSQRLQEKSRESIVTSLSDDLVKEAVSQMIAIIKKRRERLAQSQIESDEKPHREKDKDKNKEKEKKVPEYFEGRVSPPWPGDVSPRSDTSISPHPETSPRYMEKYMVHIPHHKGGKEARPRSPDRTRSPESHRDPLSPPGSPGSKREHRFLDGDELHRRLASLQLTEQQGEVWERGEDEFNNAELGDDDDEGYSRPRGPSIVFDVPHSSTEVPLLVSNYLSVYYDNQREGQPLDDVSVPPELVSSTDSEDQETCSKRVYQKLVFELTGDAFRDLLAEEAQSHPLPWMKPKRRRKPRFHHGMRRLQEIDDYLPVVQQRVMHLVGLGDARPTLESVRRKTPLKTGKKDVVDAILIQELREEEPQWIDYDDDELAVKFQVADAILESLMSETAMVMNVIQDRRDARREGQSQGS